STHKTSWPLSARQDPVTRPTYPVPTTLTFIVTLSVDCRTTPRPPYWPEMYGHGAVPAKTDFTRATRMPSTATADTAPRILVTGAAGFIGMHACAALLGRGWRVHGIDNLNAYYPVALKEDRLASLRRHPGAARFEFTRLDVAEAEAVSALFT